MGRKKKIIEAVNEEVIEIKKRTKKTIDEHWEVVEATEVAPESTFAAKEYDIQDELERMDSYQYSQRHNEFGNSDQY